MVRPQISSAALASAAALVIAMGASAQTTGEEPGFYISGGYTYYQFEGDNGIDSDVSAATGRVGWQFNEWLALEGDVGFGFDDGDFTFDGSEDEFDLDDNGDGDIIDVLSAPGEFGLNYMLGAYVKGSYPLSDLFDINARIGYAFFDVDSEIRTPGGTTIDFGDSESGFSGGVGAVWKFNEHHAARVDYTYTDFDLATADAFGIMYQFKF